MNKEEIKIITLGDIFRNIETEEQAFEFLKYIKNLQQENQELKKQLENKYSKTGILTNEVLYEENTKLINQQKEFINYLENCINELKKESMNKLQNTINLGIVDITKEILSKFKSIIGVRNE